MKITVECINTPTCMHCGEDITVHDDIAIYWEGSIERDLPAGLYHNECYMPNFISILKGEK
jgi:hypothetical protein